jgi:hypothetical protein
VITLLSAAYLLEKYGLNLVIGVMRYSIFIVVVYGFISFLSLNFLNQLIGIPFITYTGSEFIINERNIDRGALLKMISTYNNGNILGINLLIWGFLPIAFYQKSSPIILNGLRAVFLLTLSRTVWLGWILSEIILNTFFRKWNMQKFGFFVFIPIASACVYLVISAFFVDPLAFLFDTQLGGRLYQVQSEFELISSVPFDGIREIVYAGMVKNFGYIGFFLFFVSWFWMLFIPVRRYQTKLLKFCIFIYAILCGSDGAFVVLPTQSTYWFIVQMYFFCLLLELAESKGRYRSGDKRNNQLRKDFSSSIT